MRENLSYLTDEEIENTNRLFYIRNQKPEKIELVETTDSRSNTPTYSIKCPQCGGFNGGPTGYNIWPRDVTKNNTRNLKHALESGGDSISIGFECEECGGDYEITFHKRCALEITMTQKGYYIRGHSND